MRPMTPVTTMAPKPSSSSMSPRMRPTNRPMTLGCTDPSRCSDNSGGGAAGAPAAQPAGGAGSRVATAEEDDGHAACGARWRLAGQGAVGLEDLGEGGLLAPPVGVGVEHLAAPGRPHLVAGGAGSHAEDLVGVHGPVVSPAAGSSATG